MRNRAALSLFLVACVAVSIVLMVATRPRAPRAAPSAPGTPPVAIPAEPRRIVSLAPNITETLFALGLGDRVVGVSSYTVYPPEALQRPVVGALYDVSLEKLVALQPDLVIVQQKHEKVQALCDLRKIALLRVDMGRVDTILDGIRLLGQTLHASDRAETLRRQVQSDLDAVRRRAEGRPRAKVFLCVEHQPGSLKGIFTAGGQSFLTDLLALAGGDNVFADVDADYASVSTEALVARAPDAIIETLVSQEFTPQALRQLRDDWSGLPGIPAVKAGRIVVLTDDFIVVPGPRVGLIAQRLADALEEGASGGR